MVSRIPAHARSYATAGNFVNLKNAFFKPDRLLNNCKNTINNGNTFYKSLVGADKVEKQREALIGLKGKMITAKENLEISDGLLKKTQYDIKRLDGEISRTDRLKHYEKFAELLKKESELKAKEKENMESVKTNEYKRDVIQAKMDQTKTAILMLEKDQSNYLLWLKYFFCFMSLLSGGLYLRNDQKILASIDELKRMNRGSGFEKMLGNMYGGFCWSMQKAYGGLKCIANVSWIGGKWLAVESADKTAKAARYSWGYVTWGASSAYNQTTRWIYGDRK